MRAGGRDPFLLERQEVRVLVYGCKVQKETPYGVESAREKGVDSPWWG